MHNPAELPHPLEFALKYDGTDLAVLSAVFGEADEREFVDYIGSKPTGKYARRACGMQVTMTSPWRHSLDH